MENENEASNVVIKTITPQAGDAPPPYDAVIVRMKQVDSTRKDDWLIWSVFNVLFGTWCLGLPALFFSIRSNQQYNDGKYEEARDSARTAKKLNIIALISWIISTVGAIMLYFLIKSD